MSGLARHLRESNAKNTGQGIGEWVGIIVAALLAAFILRQYVVQSFYIPSESMLPTLEIEDRVIVNKLSYRFGEINRGDVVVFERPENDTNGTIKDLIKRVIALPGDTIEARADNAVYVNGTKVNEPYLKSNTPTILLPLQTVPQNKLFVMGDNRTDSFDSRRFGPIDDELVIGRAALLIWPLSNSGTL